MIIWPASVLVKAFDRAPIARCAACFAVEEIWGSMFRESRFATPAGILQQKQKGCTRLSAEGQELPAEVNEEAEAGLRATGLMRTQ